MSRRALLHGVIAGLVRRTWLVTIVAVIACAAFAATAVAALVEAAYLAPSPRAASPLAGRPGEAARTGAPTRHRSDGGSLVARNMFCSTCDPSPEGHGPTDSFSPPGTLIAIAIGGDTRTATIAIAPDVFGSWDLGAVVPRLGTIARIDRGSIEVVDAQGRHGRLALDRTVPPPPKEPAAAEPWADRIRAIDDHTFEVDRELVRELVSGATKPGAVRITPVPGENGTLAGLRLGGVPPSSLPAALGLKAADVLEAIDGTRIASAQTLLDFYAKLDKLRTVRLDGTRAGKPLTIELRLR